MGLLFFPQMASNICQRLFKKVWKSYATDLPKAPESEGIYAIGFLQQYPPGVEVLYVGRSIHIRTRLRQHKYEKQEISKFVKYQFDLNDGINLYMKWVEVENTQCLEEGYLDCMEEKLGYWPRYNFRRGDTCN